MKMCAEKKGFQLICVLTFTFIIRSVAAEYGIVKQFTDRTNTTRIRRQAECGFRCDNGDCIREDAECDGKTDCTDESDETTKCKRLNCPGYLFRCNYGACINPDRKCNGIKDCRDNSDEISPNCETNTKTCQPEEFQCDDGTCISEDMKCDGKAECPDTSDESSATCSAMKCPGFTHRCIYGACVDGNAKCNGVKDCFDGSDENPEICKSQPKPPKKPSKPSTLPTPIRPPGSCKLPNHPIHGKWELYGMTPVQMNPGDFVDSGTILQIFCNKKHKYLGNSLPICQNGVWSDPIGQCRVLCSPLVDSDRMKVTCTRDRYRVNCSEPESGTVATFKCDVYYEPESINSPLYRVCSEGTWDRPKPVCVPVCGIKSVTATTLLINASIASKNDYPWQVALYYISSNGQRNFQCGGALINQKIVLTAAHCVTNNRIEVVSNELLEVGVGKHYSKYKDDRETDAQYSPIAQVHVPPRYRGPEQNYLADIAILITQKTFTLSWRVQPICMDWNRNYEIEFQRNPNLTGYVSGWGFTETSDKPSDELRELKSPYITQQTCRESLPPDYAVYLTYDKICSGYLNEGKSACKGDSGGSLVFQTHDTKRYYSTGIVSVSPQKFGTCDSQHYTLYTHVYDHMEFISRLFALHSV